MRQFKVVFVIAVLLCILMLTAILVVAQDTRPGAPGKPYPNMPLIAPIGERIEKYTTVNESAKGPSIDLNKSYHIQQPDKGLYIITDNAYPSAVTSISKWLIHTKYLKLFFYETLLKRF